ncbi:zinc finger protein with KRAB and SCAN domains 5-like [Anguilla anguilla]|uniref:zinc finger protein with KRAB and SCAN domains 5-like n=1 Tax=Anguilla anguilla TaxID=7936 RepID=UPI0015B027EA|nr:zinc finger protein with KRAB and SCAN domains 5-like [Anguilla anguilla]
MSKLDVLNAYLRERLMVAVREIITAVGETVLEFKEETARTSRENEHLRQRLREDGVGGSGPMSGAAHPPSPHTEQEWSSGLMDELAGNEEGRSGGEKQRCEHKNEELGGQPFDQATCRKPECVQLGVHALACGVAGSPFKRHSVKQDLDQNSVQPTAHLNLQAVGKAETDLPPPPTSDRVKDEPEAMQCTAELSAESLESLNPTGTGSSHGICMESPVSATAVEKCEGTPRVLKGKMKHLCSQCGKAFSQASGLRVHLQFHSGRKPHSCTHCEKTFFYRGHLKEHERIHTGERPYKCSFCGKCFRLCGHLNQHERIHTGERPFSCTQCGKNFIQRGNLNVHLRIHSGEAT